MAKKVKSESTEEISVKEIGIGQIRLDEDIYPRAEYGYQTAYGYSQAILSGANFPPIVVALFKGDYYLVDGRHRIEAYKMLKRQDIPAEIHENWDKRKIYEEAIRRNIAHGKPLTPYDKRRIALKLRQMKYPNEFVSGLINVPLEKLENFINQRLISSTTGVVIVDRQIVKSGIKHLAGPGMSYNPIEVRRITEDQKEMYSGSQERLLKELITIIREGLLDTKNNRVMKLFSELQELLALGVKNE